MLAFSAMALSLGAVSAQAQTKNVVEPAPAESSSSMLSDWWNGKYMSGNWFGFRDTLEENGLKLSGKWTGVFYGLVDGGSKGYARGYFDEEIAFDGELDFAKFTKWETLEGLKAFGGVRWRDGDNPNEGVGASSNFQPSHFQSGKQWRLTTAGLTYTTPELFGAKQFLTITGGWIRPQKEFVDQPLSKLFVNNSFESSKGIGGNIPFSSSFSTWGGALTLRPLKWYYAKAGLFMAYPQATNTYNHGLAFQGYAPNTSLNGLMVMAETGFTPTIGESKLPGKYVFGGYNFGVANNSFLGGRNQGQYGFYWQADQMLFREASPAAEEPAPMGKDGKSTSASGKSFKEPVPSKPAKLNEQGLSTFNLFTFAPANNNILPFYFQSGLVYKGLIPTRDSDLTMIAFGYGNYSYDNIQLQQNRGNPNQPNYTAVLEGDYRIQINKWSYFQPYIQYIIKPNGTGAIQNATILGFMTGLVF